MLYPHEPGIIKNGLPVSNTALKVLPSTSYEINNSCPVYINGTVVVVVEVISVAAAAVGMIIVVVKSSSAYPVRGFDSIAANKEADDDVDPTPAKKLRLDVVVVVGKSNVHCCFLS